VTNTGTATHNDTAHDLDTLSINTIRMLSVDAVEAAKSGHPGAPMGQAPMAYALWHRVMKHNPANPNWPDRDRFVLSAGHASMLLYSLLHLTGYDLPLEQIKAFRQWESATPGHPEASHTPGVEVTTGPLGAGFSMAVGMALAERWLAAHFNREGHAIVDHYTYGICSDGDLMEGVAAEAASLAGTLGLGKLIFFYDDNNITIDGETSLSFTEDVGQRFEAYGWHVQHVADGADLDAIESALKAARAEGSRPSLIAVKTRIGEGSPNKVGKAAAHGSPLGGDEVTLTREALGWPSNEPFHVPGEVRESMGAARERGAKAEAEWKARFDAYRGAHPALAAEFERSIAGQLPEGWLSALPTWEKGEQVETRVASGKTLNVLAEVLPNLIGGSADLAGSNNTMLSGAGNQSAAEPAGRNVFYGVREHAMGGVLNGLARHGGIVPYGGTFLTFSDYMRPAVRLAALMQADVAYVFTHDSIGLGEDGPTHQPVEHLASLRAMPGLSVLRPADANETAAAWAVALENPGPAALALTRQKVPVITTPDQALEGVRRGAYVLSDCEGEPQALLLATGSEVSIALEAQGALAEKGIPTRVVSMPSWDRFEVQPAGYREFVLPPSVRVRVAVEAASSFGWHRWVGEAGEIVSVDRFGASAPYAVIYKEFGITAENVVARTLAALERTG
jgi:transketolase